MDSISCLSCQYYSFLGFSVGYSLFDNLSKKEKKAPPVFTLCKKDFDIYKTISKFIQHVKWRYLHMKSPKHTYAPADNDHQDPINQKLTSSMAKFRKRLNPKRKPRRPRP